MSRTDRMAGYANDIARRSPPEYQQFVLDYVESQYLEAVDGKRAWIDKLIKYMERIVNEINAGTFDFPVSKPPVSKSPASQAQGDDIFQKKKELVADIVHLEKMIKETDDETNKEALIKEQMYKNKLLEEM